MTGLSEVKDRGVIMRYLDTKERGENDADRWIRRWNDYLSRLKFFYRWLYNVKMNDEKGQIVVRLSIGRLLLLLASRNTKANRQAPTLLQKSGS